MPHFANLPLAQQHFDNVKTHLHWMQRQHAQVIECCFGEQSAFATIHGRRRTRPIFRGARLDFDEYETIPVAKDEIDFSAAGAKIRREKLQAKTFEVAFRRSLAQAATLKVERLFSLVQASLEPLLEIDHPSRLRDSQLIPPGGSHGFDCDRIRKAPAQQVETAQNFGDEWGTGQAC